MAVAKEVLDKCDPALLDLYGDSEQTDYEDSARIVLLLMDRRRVQKVMWRQLSVLDSMMALLEGLESAKQLLTEPCPPHPDNAARGRWKALKAETRAGVEETEALLSTLQDRVEQIHARRQKIAQLVQQLQKKREQSEKVEALLQKAQNALQVCERQLTPLRMECLGVLGCLDNWQLVRDKLQHYVSAAQDVMQFKLLPVSQTELYVELRPQPCGSNSSNELEPLKLSVSWSHDDRFKLQVNPGTTGMVEECMQGRLSELSATLLEVAQSYSSQGGMLAEIQALHSSFAIDWRPAKRVLVYLKSASVVCSLEVEEGYPAAGRAKLLSVRRDAQLVDTATLRPHKDNLSLTEWLVFLCSSPLI